jgi:hypothetical protein
MRENFSTISKDTNTQHEGGKVVKHKTEDVEKAVRSE